eukprot:TRINITY_DN28977_c0_g1_i1.p1 TRINITY_DN28977_c0_g1~~TRINITY_DN28977_c0_g1_i1.p1  ORF type:complete len:1368 (-),score=147.58 TRINITY_DN28977_c0_g1_i1:695-4798(-)
MEDSALPGNDPPPLPSFTRLVKVVTKKNLFLGCKRGRLVAALIPVCMQMGIVVAIYFGVRNAEPLMRRVIMASFMPLNTFICVQNAMQPAIADIIGEKESKMSITQMIYGVTNATFWTTWLAFYAGIALFSISVMFVFLYAVAPILHGVNVLLSLVLFSVAFAQHILFVCCVSVFLESQKTASIISNIVTYVLLAGAAAMQFVLRDNPWLPYLVGAVPIANVYQALSSMIWLSGGLVCDDSGDCKTLGANFNTLFESRVCVHEYRPPLNECQFSADFFPLGPGLILVLFDLVILSMLVWWFSNIWQGKYGLAKPLCFCIMPEFIRPRRGIESDASVTSSSVLSIKNMCKTFPSGKVALSDMSLEANKGEIFALLGHNGAGKTTAINCVVGLLAPTSGEAFVNGFNTRTDLTMARHQMSVCPQDNPIYAEFTVRQHLKFFGALRGVPEDQIDQRAGTILNALGMTDKVDHPSGKLSGGQKRRLWVATALIGDSPIAFLDEPTSGMDPSSRRELWDMLLRIRDTGRCVIFTTHYLDEADIIADRKAVLARGRVQAVGTSHDLKRKFGVGYRLLLELSPCDVSAVEPVLESFVKEHVKTASLEKSDVDGRMIQQPEGCQRSEQVSIMMPFDQSSRFADLLVALGQQREKLKISNFSLSMSTLEDVFMTLGRQAEVEAQREAEAAHGAHVVNVDFQEIEQDAIAQAHRVESSDRRSLLALCRIRLKPIVNNRTRFVLVFIVPVMFEVLAVELSRMGASETNPGGNAYALVLYSGVAFGFSLYNQVQDLIVDLKNKCKHISMCQGMSPKAYWSGNFLAHYMTLLPISVCFITVFILRRPLTIIDSSIPLVTLMALLYPVNIIFFVYNLAAAFSNGETAAKALPAIYSLSMFLPSMTVVVLSSPWFNHMPSIQSAALVIHITCSAANPAYALPGTLAYVLNKDSIAGLSVWQFFSSTSAIPLYLWPISLMIFAGTLILLDSRSFANPHVDPVEDDMGESSKDDDVKAEEIRCREHDGANEAARYQNLSHTYRLPDVGSAPNICAYVTRKFKYVNAVRGVSLGIQIGECFSLLGPNGAGKTTTLGVLTGELRRPSEGQIYIHGHDLSKAKERRKAYELLGVCPQVDPLWDDISGKDHLLYYGRVKGVPEAELGEVADNLLHRLGLQTADAKRPTGQYSGGMKRKLSVAIALIGHSQMIFLDEPSAAVDAGAKRHLWKVIKKRASDQTVVLTTHSMEEAEALSSRMAIQTRGQLRCLGTPAHIKRKYGTGYELEVFVKYSTTTTSIAQEQDEELKSFVQREISSSAELIEKHADRYLFKLSVQNGSLDLSTVFRVMELKKAGNFGIVDYSIAQPSLEQVFLRFAKEQYDYDKSNE